MSKTVIAHLLLCPCFYGFTITNAQLLLYSIHIVPTQCVKKGESYTLTAPANYTGIQWFTLSGATAMPDSGANTNILVVTQAGTYYYTATDNASCAIELCCPVTMTTVSNPLPSISIVTVPDCGLSNGALTATVTGGTSPYTYLWSTIPAQTLASAGI
ncbi:MAG: SprB repeat-containing protein [Saprospiraceae bacterium]